MLTRTISIAFLSFQYIPAHFSGVACANNKNRHYFENFHDVTNTICPIFSNFKKNGFLPDFLAKFSWLFDELLENRLICDKQIRYLAKYERKSYNKQYSGCKPILNDTKYQVII